MSLTPGDDHASILTPLRPRCAVHGGCGCPQRDAVERPDPANSPRTAGGATEAARAATKAARGAAEAARAAAETTGSGPGRETGRTRASAGSPSPGRRAL